MIIFLFCRIYKWINFLFEYKRRTYFLIECINKLFCATKIVTFGSTKLEPLFLIWDVHLGWHSFQTQRFRRSIFIRPLGWNKSRLIKKRYKLKNFKDLVSCLGFKKWIFFTYFGSIIYWEYTVKILDRNMKYLRSYSTWSRTRRD